jgi:hypothetical protein
MEKDFALLEISQTGLVILASQSAEESIWRDCHSVQVAFVAFSLQSANATP